MSIATDINANEPKNGVWRRKSPKGKGYWLAHFKGQERVFYDGSYGTELVARNAADKWYLEASKGKEGAAELQKVAVLLDWIEKERKALEAMTAKEAVGEIEDEITRTFLM